MARPLAFCAAFLALCLRASSRTVHKFITVCFTNLAIIAKKNKKNFYSDSTFTRAIAIIAEKNKKNYLPLAVSRRQVALRLT